MKVTIDKSIDVLKYLKTKNPQLESLDIAIETLQEKSNILSEYERLVNSMKDATPIEVSRMVDDFCITTMRKLLTDHYSKMILAEDKNSS